MRVVKVDKYCFELEDGSVYDHPVELDIIPSVEEFQKIYDGWFDKIVDVLGINNE